MEERLPLAVRVFIALPFEHSENLADQEVRRDAVQSVGDAGLLDLPQNSGEGLCAEGWRRVARLGQGLGSGAMSVQGRQVGQVKEHLGVQVSRRVSRRDLAVGLGGSSSWGQSRSSTPWPHPVLASEPSPPEPILA